MYRGTTPRLIFKVPYETSLIDKLYITFHQKDRKQFEKTKADCTFDGCLIYLRLTQEDTLRLVTNTPLEIQIRALLTDGTAGASKPIKTTVYDVLKDGVI